MVIFRKGDTVRESWGRTTYEVIRMVDDTHFDLLYKKKNKIYSYISTKYLVLVKRKQVIYKGEKYA